ncbi:CHAP domain-containing protein [Macrococcus capreoli]|uniref:CHAP domain-containing protein n=1 Tax=Macrococcus capreoli TaxID=2982690 RepID=UPI0021D5EB91|nr:CHAP domain-containing protein [Macrococcus sp. TMW 2.2395]MCU7556521.1 N-acetylmuramoyl-L-alanine amidase [Macrococcus sp. TMW 2.2395]
MAFSITQYDTRRDCYKDRGILKVGAQYDHILESHMDAFNNASAQDAHIVIKAGYAADNADRAIVSVLKKYFGVRYNDGIMYRDDLQNMNDAIGKASYRLAEFGFITNAEERNIFVKQMDNIAKDIAAALVKIGGKWLLIAGHGAGDPGAMAGGYKEADLVRQLNAKIVAHCNALTAPKKAAPKPVVKPAAKPNPVAAPSKPTQKVYVAVQGDTQYSIAKKKGITLDDLRKWNGLKTTKTFIGQKFYVSAPVQAAPKSAVNAPVKQKVPAKPSPNRTYAELVAKTKGYVGKAVDFDGAFKFQCMDVACDYIFYATKGAFRPWGNARDLLKNKFPSGWKTVPNTPELVPKVGWLAVYSVGWADNDFGHVALVYANPTRWTMDVVEQNWDGKANKAASVRRCNYDGVSHFIIPPGAE